MSLSNTSETLKPVTTAPPPNEAIPLPQLFAAIKHLSPPERLMLVEALVQLLREDLQPVERRARLRQQMAAAAEALKQDYESGAVTEYTGCEAKKDLEEKRQRLAEAAQAALPYYLSDPELTIFTALDSEDFYEYEER